jgi:hypothetical protein
MKLSFNGKGNRRFTAAPPQLSENLIYAQLRLEIKLIFNEVYVFLPTTGNFFSFYVVELTD